MISLYKGGAIPIAPPIKLVVRWTYQADIYSINVEKLNRSRGIVCFTWKVRVEVLALLHVDPSWGVAVSVQQVVDVVLATVPGESRLNKMGKNLGSPAQGNEGEIWGDGSIVGIGSCSIVGKGPVNSVLDLHSKDRTKLNKTSDSKGHNTRHSTEAVAILRKVVGKLARPHEHLPVLCWAIQELSSSHVRKHLGSANLLGSTWSSSARALASSSVWVTSTRFLYIEIFLWRLKYDAKQLMYDINKSSMTQEGEVCSQPGSPTH